MRKPRRITQADYHAAGRGFARDVAEGLAKIEKREAEREPRAYRIRRCEGNRNAWLIVALRPDGTEIDSFGGWTTSYSVDTLLKSSGHLTPKSGDRVELIP